MRKKAGLPAGEKDPGRAKHPVRPLRRWMPQILCAAGGILLYVWAAAGGWGDDGLKEGYLRRGGYGEDSRVYEFLVEGLADGPVPCRVEIGAMQYTEEEARQRFGSILETLGSRILGDNESLSGVSSDLVLPTEFEDAGIRARWRSDAPDILDSGGKIRAEQLPEEGADVWLTVELTDGTHQAESTFPVKVVPAEKPEEQALAEALAAEIQKNAASRPAEPLVELPKVYGGKTLRYRGENGAYRFLPLLGVLFGFLLWARDKERVRTGNRRRQESLLLDYADVVYQLMVFAGAGLTVPKAWERIVLNYEERKKAGRCEERPAYEEMAAARDRMACGVPEGQAIAEFGLRCRLPPYRKLTGLLEQNRRTGTRDLALLLEQEMTSAWEQQKAIARRLGEEAGTRLLLPLVLLLLVVMVIIMVPAMMSLG